MAGLMEVAPGPESKVREWIADFETDSPLYIHFPLLLVNGKSVPGVHVVCSKCGGRISGDRIHGRVMQSLAHVVTVAANGICQPCNRMTHIDCRFRANPNETVVEWLSSSGRWQSREVRPPSLGEKIASAARRVAARLVQGT